mmetsp:Transcript_1166/g.2876  ORF Transcript_1166/g.2876 Transcript_1166/m.2876 type:complete len:175 (-) Transcript_1166:354-878(-)
MVLPFAVPPVAALLPPPIMMVFITMRRMDGSSHGHGLRALAQLLFAILPRGTRTTSELPKAIVIPAPRALPRHVRPVRHRHRGEQPTSRRVLQHPRPPPPSASAVGSPSFRLSISDMQNTASSPPNWFVRMGTPIYADDLAGPPPMQGRGRQKKLPTPCQRQVSIASYVTSTAA